MAGGAKISWTGIPSPTPACVPTEVPSLPVNVSHNTQGVLNEPPHDVSNGMDQSDGNVKLRALSPN
ncbi:hypothetical protein DSO57_1029350 [Entomophthora muscae]|uniref:Uncharacterized protein n=1 Tax=Entomophthora muscae TaxID=34485 RepID=A0ACC2UBB1_9FUNG|nr:hypothetical protein DSO57_1029350 [Entomophthora muscae]